MYHQKVDKKFGNKGTSHPIASPYSKIRSSSIEEFHPTTLSIEIMEVKQGMDKNEPIVGGPYVCILEVTDSTLNQTLWKQKSSAQFTTKPPIIFGDVFKVKTSSGDWGVDIKPGFQLRVQLCKVEDKSLIQIDSGVFQLQDLVVNKEQKEDILLGEKKAEMVLRLSLSNSQYPRGNTFTLHEIHSKEKEKEKAQERATEEMEKEGGSAIQRTTSMSSTYSLPRVSVRFSINYHTNPGEDIRVVGSNYKLGDWEASKAPILEWTHKDIWVAELSFRKVFLPFEYKYVVYDNNTGSTRWETIPNRKVDVTEEDMIDRPEIWDQ